MNGTQRQKKNKSIFDEFELKPTNVFDMVPDQELVEEPKPAPMPELRPLPAHERTETPWWQKYDADASEKAATETVKQAGRTAWDIIKRSKPARLIMDPPFRDTLTPTGRMPTLVGAGFGMPTAIPSTMLGMSPRQVQEQYREVPPEEWWSNTTFLPEVITKIEREGDRRPLMIANLGFGGTRVFQPGPKLSGTLLGLQDIAQSFATPTNAMLMLALPAVSGARLIKTAIEAKFSLDMLSHAVQQYPEVVRAFQEGDEEGGMRALVNALGGTTLGITLGRAAYKSGKGWTESQRVAKKEADLVDAQRRNNEALMKADPEIIAKTIDMYGNLDPMIRGYYQNLENIPTEALMKIPRGRQILMERIRREVEGSEPSQPPRERIVYEGEPTGRLDVWEQAKAAEAEQRGFRVEERRGRQRPGTGEPGDAPPGRVSPLESQIASDFDAELKNLAKTRMPVYTESGESAIALRGEAGGAGAAPVSGRPSQPLPSLIERSKQIASDIRTEGFPVQPDLSMDASDVIMRIANGQTLGFGGTGEFKQFVPEVFDRWLEKFRTNSKVRETYSPREIDNFARGFEMTQKIFGDEGFGLFPKVEKGSSVHPNLDYGQDFSLTTICGQQDLYNFIIREVERTGGKLLDPHKRFLVGEMIAEAGGKPACFFCYGQGGRNAFEHGFEKLTNIFEAARKLPAAATEAQIKEAFQGWSFQNKKGEPSLLMRLVNKYGKSQLAARVMRDPVRLRDVAMGMKDPVNKVEADIAQVSQKILQGAYKPNQPKGYSPYMDEVLRWSPQTVIAQNNYGGARINSQTDFRVWHTMDLAKFLAHLKAKNSMAHVFTRQPAIIDIFGNTGMKFNISMEFAKDTEGKIMRYADGTPMIDEMNTMPWEKILEYRKKYRRDVGSMLVAMTKEDILEGLRNPNVDMIIPNHRGKVAKETLAFKGAEDWTKYQNDKWGKEYEGRTGEVITVKMKDGSEVKVKVGQNLKRNQHHDNRARYLELVEKLGITPRFAQFTSEKGYMKLVRDVARQPSRQRVVDPTKIDWEAASRHIDRWIQEGGEPFEGPAAAGSAEAQAMLRWVQSRIKDNDWPQSPLAPQGEFAASGFGAVQKLFDTEEVRIANRTSRGVGAVGARAITPRYVQDTAKPGEKILDFGAGKDAVHTQALRQAGHDVTAYEFGDNVVEGLHDPMALGRNYNTVYASNVLNVQSSRGMLDTTIDQIASATRRSGRAVVNYPESPRYTNLTGEDIKRALGKRFESVKRVGGTASAPLFEAKKPFTTSFAGGADVSKLAADIVRRLRNEGVPERDLSTSLRRIVDPHYVLTSRQVVQAIQDSRTRKTPPSSTIDPDAVLDQVQKHLSPLVARRTVRIPKGKNILEALQTAFTSQMTPLRYLQRNVYQQAGLKMPVQDLARHFELVPGAAAQAQFDVVNFKKAIDPILDKPQDFNTYIFLKRTADRLDMDPQTRRVGEWTLEQAEAGLEGLRRRLGNERYNQMEAVAMSYQELMDQALRRQVESGRLSEQDYDAIKSKNNFYAPFKVLRELESEQMATGGGRGIADTRPLTQRITGIDDADFYLGDFMQASTEYIVRSRMLAEKNAAMIELDKLATVDKTGQFLVRFKGPQFIPPKEAGGRGYWVRPKDIPQDWAVLPYLRNGERWAIATNPKVAQAVNGLNAAQTGILAKIAQKGAVPFRAGATAFNLTFQPINLFLADPIRAMMVSKYGLQMRPDKLAMDIVRFPFDWANSFWSAFTGNYRIPGVGQINRLLPEKLNIPTPDNPTHSYLKAQMMGILNSTIQRELTPKAFERELKLRYKAQNSKEYLARAGQQILDTPAQWSNAFEETTKVLGAKRGWRIEGIDKLPPHLRVQRMREIATEVRNYFGSPDFLRRGTVGKELNLLMMFWNARMQGVSSDLMRLAGRTSTPAETAQVYLRLAAGIGIPAVLATLHALSDENRADYDQIPGWEKDNYFHIFRHNADGSKKFFINEQGQKVREAWRIQKREIVKMLANPIQEMMKFFIVNEPGQASKVAWQFLESVSPFNVEGRNWTERGESVLSGMNPVVKAPYETFTGYDLFRHRYHITEQERKLRGTEFAHEIYTNRTPETFVKLGKATNTPPKAWEQATQGITAGMITQFMIKPPQPGRSKYTEYPVFKRFVRSAYTANDELQQLLRSAEAKDTAEQLRLRREAEVTYKELQDRGLNAREIDVALADMKKERPRLYTRLKNIHRDETRGIDFYDRQLRQISWVGGHRVAAMRSILSQMDEEHRRIQIQEWLDKKLLTAKYKRDVTKNLVGK